MKYLRGTNSISELAAGPILLFDDDCGFCNATVNIILRYDRRCSLRFASLHGEYGLALRQRYPQLNAIDSIIWVTSRDDGSLSHILTHSEAVFAVAAYLGGIFRLLTLGRLIPKRLADAAYRLFARHRHKFSIVFKQCRIPTPAQRSRFLP